MSEYDYDLWLEEVIQHLAKAKEMRMTAEYENDVKESAEYHSQIKQVNPFFVIDGEYQIPGFVVEE